MNRYLALFLIAPLVMAACTKETLPTASASKAESGEGAAASLARPIEYREQDNLAALANGGVVVERSSEEGLDRAAAFAIDSFLDTAWVTPPGDPLQSATIALAAPARVTQLGMTTRGPGGAGRAVRKLRVEASSDGASWRELGVLVSERPAETVKLPLQPVEAAFLRLSIAESASPRNAAELPSIEVHGTRLRPRQAPAVTGRWTMPGGEIVLAEKGTTVSGRCTMAESDPLLFEGRVRDGVAMFGWTRGPEVGFGALAVSEAGDVLNAVLWHEKPIALFTATSWIARRSGGGDVSSRDERSTALQFLQVIGRYPSYFIDFSNDAVGELTPGHLDMLLSVVRSNPSHKFTLAVMHAGEDAEEANNRVTESRAAALRAAIAKRGANFANLAVVGRGSHYDHDVPLNELDRKLYDRVDLEIESFDASRSIQTLRLR